MAVSSTVASGWGSRLAAISATVAYRGSSSSIRTRQPRPAISKALAIHGVARPRLLRLREQTRTRRARTSPLRVEAEAVEALHFSPFFLQVTKWLLNRLLATVRRCFFRRGD